MWYLSLAVIGFAPLARLENIWIFKLKNILFGTFFDASLYLQTYYHFR